MLFLFGKLLVFGIRAAWGISKIVLTVVFLPIILIALVAGGLFYIAFPILIVLGLVSLLSLIHILEVPYLTHYYENTIVVYSYSKALSIPGERIGYIAMEPCVQDYEDLIAGMTASMRYLGYVNAPSLQQKMLLKCVDASVAVSYTHLARCSGSRHSFLA